MDQALFRGERIDNGGWVYGSYIHCPQPVCIGRSHPYCMWVPAANPDETTTIVEVDLDTVGQFIGVLDKNKRQIFDGDIVRTKYGRICKVVWFAPQLCWDLYPLESKSKAPDTYDLFKGENLEVIGNIYDNPEILKEGNELYV